jgi:hypothetical protein
MSSIGTDRNKTYSITSHNRSFEQSQVLSSVLRICSRLFFKGSFGREEFSRTTTHMATLTPLAIVPNDRKTYEKPFRLRSIQLDENA